VRYLVHADRSSALAVLGDARLFPGPMRDLLRGKGRGERSSALAVLGDAQLFPEPLRDLPRRKGRGTGTVGPLPNSSRGG
jgi:hypothetical protein